VRVYFRETQSWCSTSHRHSSFMAASGRGIYDNMKRGRGDLRCKARRYIRFLQMCSHHLIEPCLHPPRDGERPGREQVGNLRDQMFRQNLGSRVSRAERVAGRSMLAYAKRTKHPELRIARLEVLRTNAKPDGASRPLRRFVEKAVRAAHVPDHGDHNRYSVDARAAAGCAGALHAERVS